MHRNFLIVGSLIWKFIKFRNNEIFEDKQNSFEISILPRFEAFWQIFDLNSIFVHVLLELSKQVVTVDVVSVTLTCFFKSTVILCSLLSKRDLNGIGVLEKYIKWTRNSNFYSLFALNLIPICIGWIWIDLILNPLHVFLKICTNTLTIARNFLTQISKHILNMQRSQIF